MATQYANRIRVTLTSTGTGTANIGTALAGFQAITVLTSGSTIGYAIDDVGSQWEIGTGVYTSGSPGTITRTNIEASTNSGAAISLSGNATMMVTLTAAQLTAIQAPTATGSSTARTLANRANDVANVLDYGGGIGGDDALAARNALASGKGVILIPPGSYTFKSRPDQPGPFDYVPPPCILFNGLQNVVVIAYGADFFIDNSIAVPNTDSTYLNAGTTFCGYIGNCKHIRWYGGRFHSNTATLSPAAPNLMWFQNVTDIVIEDTESIGPYTSGSLFAGVWMFDCAFRRNVCHGAGIGFDLAYTENLDIDSNQFFGNLGAGNAAATGFKLFSDPNTATFNTIGQTLAVVTWSDGSTRALRNGQSNGLRLHGNTFSGWGDNVYVDGVSGAEIASNLIAAAPTSGSAAGIVVDVSSQTHTAGFITRDVLIRDNDIADNGGPAIVFATEGYGLDGIAVLDNRIYDNTCAAALTFNQDTALGYFRIEGNDFRSRASLSVQSAPIDTVDIVPLLVTAGGIFRGNFGVASPNDGQAGAFTSLSASSGINFGSVAASSPTDLSKQINLYGGNVGFSVTSGRLNYEVPSGASHAFQVSGSDVVTLDANGISGKIGATSPAAGAFTTFGANSATPSGQITISGSRGSATAAVLESLLQALVTFGLITDSTTA